MICFPLGVVNFAPLLSLYFEDQNAYNRVHTSRAFHNDKRVTLSVDSPDLKKKSFRRGELSMAFATFVSFLVVALALFPFAASHSLV